MSQNWIDNSHPEPEERANGRRRDALPGDVNLRDALLAHRERHAMTNSSLATELGFSPSVISQYLADGGNKYPGDIARLERRVTDYLTNYERRRLIGVPLITTDQTRQVASALESIRRTGDAGIICGDAGLGKTSGILLYVQDNPTCLCITLVRSKRTETAIEGMVFDAVGRGNWQGNTKRWDHIVARTCASNRLLIVDNAHKATKAGLEWLFDWHDETRCPLALVGNEEVLKNVEDNDQRFSRIGLKLAVRLRRPKPMLRHLVNVLAPDAGDQLDLLSEQVAEHRGRYRAVAKQLTLAAALREGKPDLAWSDAFRAAHGMLVRNYRIEEAA